MKRISLVGYAFLLTLGASFFNSAFGQTYTINNSFTGDWNAPSTTTWTSDPPWLSNLTTSTTSSIINWGTNSTVYFPKQTSPPSVTQVIGGMTMTNKDQIVIGDGSATDILQIGDNSTPGSLTVNGSTGNNVTITINKFSTLEIYGDLNFTNQFNLDVQGTLIVHGNFVTGNSSDVIVTSGGSVSVGGDISVGNASCLTVDPGGSFTQSPNKTCSGGSSCAGGSSFCSAVPIKISSFQGITHNSEVELNWSTASEINFDHFLLERSSNGKNFSELTKVQGSGNSNTRKDYSYTDNNPFIGNSYYRLTSIDFDGYTEVFNDNVVRVTVHTGKNFYISPNPIESLNLKAGINFDGTNNRIVVYDRMGTVVAQYSVSGTLFDLQLPHLPNGVYFAQIQSEGFTKSLRFVVNQ